MTLQNWYSSIDRSSAHGVGSATGGSAIAGCTTVSSTDNVVLCSMNGDRALDAHFNSSSRSSKSNSNRRLIRSCSY